MGKSSNYEKGHEKGYAEGFADEPCSAPSRVLNFLNTQSQQDYEDGLRDGHKAGQANPFRKKK